MTLSQLPPLWKEAPFIRIIIPFAIGVAVANQVFFNPFFTSLIFLCSAACLILLHLTTIYLKFKLRWLTGLLIHVIFFCSGILIATYADDNRNRNSIVNTYSPGDYLQVTIEEPLIEKAHSFKALASIERIIKKDSNVNCFGRVILYFPKDSNFRRPRCGSSLLFSKILQPIQWSGNPGGFDYRTYCQRQGVHYSVYLTERDYRIIPGIKKIFLKILLFETRESVLNILSKYVPGPSESGFAKALLIGYKEDLDKSVVESYTNTGVVHVIAISGLHLGIIYWLLNLMFSPLVTIIRSKWLKALLLILGLWSFSFLAGAGPSVLRSAFMFSFIVVGQFFSRKANIYNTLAASAFILLCIDPYWLFDVGFQLSYAAVLSIVIYFRTVYNLLYFQNRTVDFIWKLNAVTLSAQILTIPITIYHFHQTPTYFLFSNLIAIPWSTLILLGEILLCTISFLPTIATGIGETIAWMIHSLNSYIGNINSLPFSTWDGLVISFPQLCFFYLFIAGTSVFLVYKRKIGVYLSLLSLLVFGLMHSYSIEQAERQKKLIVYNVSGGALIEFIEGRNSFAIADSALAKSSALFPFYLRPARTVNRINGSSRMNTVLIKGNLIRFHDKNVMLVDHRQEKLNVKSIGLLILSKNARIRLPAFLSNCKPEMIIADASNSRARVKEWKKQCSVLGVSFHDVREEGAFILDLN